MSRLSFASLRSAHRLHRGASALGALVASSLLWAACAVDVREPAPELLAHGGDARAALAPLTGSEAGADAAENQCGIVLRTVARPAGPTGGYETSCTPTGCFYVWAGTLDVDEEQLAAGATPHVLFQSSFGAQQWWEVDATETTGAGAGFRRFSFRLTEHTVTDGMSYTSLNRTRIEVVPFLRDADGNRWFDHNRNANPFQNYVLVVDNGWSIHDDASVCPSPQQPDWMGNVVARISRDSSHACNGGTAMTDSLTYSTWARERAAVRNVCFEIWEPGVTDWDNPDQWRQLDVQAHYRFAPDAPWQTTWVNALDHLGNNARYALGLGQLDPFAPYQCPAPMPTEIVSQPGGDLERARMDLYFTVNGAELRPAAGNAWQVWFEDYATNAFRDAQCP